MKKILLSFLILVTINTSASAFNLFKGESDEKTLKKIVAKIETATNKKDVDGILKYYNKSYKSFDGFNLTDLEGMLEQSFEGYDKLKFKSKVKNILIEDQRASIFLVDDTKATLKGESKKLGKGELTATSDYALNFVKNDGKWEIITDVMIAEDSCIKYGSAQEIGLDFVAPLGVSPNSQYELKLYANNLENQSVVASLGREKIVYPGVEPKEVFRKVPQDEPLERIVRSNNEGKNEYAAASIGITKANFIEDMDLIKFEMTGLAFLMKRINLIEEKAEEIKVEANVQAETEAKVEAEQK